MKNLSAALSRLSALPPAVRSAAASAALEAARLGRAHARSIVPVRTGKLRASMAARSEKDEQASLLANRPYARFVEDKKPYLRPAAQAQDYAGILEKHLKEALK